MSLLVNGQWQPDWFATESEDGAFVREDAQFRHWITADGSAGPSGEDGFAAEAGRYHLYVSLACPWAHRTLIFRQLKNLESLISVDVVHPFMGERGWSFDQHGAAQGDSLYQSDYMHQIYTRADPDYTGIVTVPVLWDKKRETIVSNESSEIIRMFNHAFDALTGNDLDFYPAQLRAEIDAINAEVYEKVNNGVYRTGFATTQEAYEQAFHELFSMLDALEARLAKQPYLVGDTLTEADWRLFTTLVRFDAVYVGHFKCNRNRLVDYPNLWAYCRALYQLGNIKHTVDMDHIKRHYYQSHDWINPTGIVPAGPEIDFSAPHQRGG